MADYHQRIRRERDQLVADIRAIRPVRPEIKLAEYGFAEGNVVMRNLLDAVKSMQSLDQKFQIGGSN